jgi:uncharacterized protein DUF6983
VQQEIQLSNSPNQTLPVSLIVDGKSLNLILFLGFNEIAEYWTMDVSDQNNNLLLASVPLITGNEPACNVLKQYAYMEIGSCFIINNTGSSIPNWPGATGWTGGWVMVWGDTP